MSAISQTRTAAGALGKGFAALSNPSVLWVIFVSLVLTILGMVGLWKLMDWLLTGYGFFTWGWATGSVATGIALLRIVDPELESGTVEDFGYAYIPLIPIEGAAVAIAPLLVVAGASWSVALIWGIIALAGFWVLARSRRPARA